MKKIVLTKDHILFSLKGTELVLKVWKSLIHAPIHSDGTQGIYIRVDHFNQYSMCLDRDDNYFLSEDLPEHIIKVLNELMEIYTFPAPIEKEEQILSILSKLKIVKRTKEW